MTIFNGSLCYPNVSPEFLPLTRPLPRSLFIAPPELGSECLNSKFCISLRGVLLRVASTMITACYLAFSYTTCVMAVGSVAEHYEYQISIISFTGQCSIGAVTNHWYLLRQVTRYDAIILY